MINHAFVEKVVLKKETYPLDFKRVIVAKSKVK